MSGHSKWSTIKHQKAANDAKRGKLFSKLSKDITVAVNEGGGPDINSNAKLRLVIEKAKVANMPKDNIQRAIDKGAKKGDVSQLETIFYEGFAPGNIAVVVECVTDNRSRCMQAIKMFFDKQGGRLGSSGATSYLFDQKGCVWVRKQEDEEAQALKLIDCGAEDIEIEKAVLKVYTTPEKLHQVVKEIDKQEFKIQDARLIFKPKLIKEVENQENIEKLKKFLIGLDELEDVQRVFSEIELAI